MKRILLAVTGTGNGIAGTVGAVVAGCSKGTDDIITRDGYDGITNEQTGRI